MEVSYVSRLEVFGMSIGKNDPDMKGIDYGFERALDLDKDTGDFKGRIFVVGECKLHEIYNSKDADKIYRDPNQEEKQDSVCSQNSSKRKFEQDFISGLVQVQDSEGFQKRAKLIEDEAKEVADFSPKSSGDSIHLPLTGPVEGIEISDMFYVVVHRDTGNPAYEDKYFDLASSMYLSGGWVPNDEVRSWVADVGSTFDEPLGINVYGDFRKLTLDCIAYEDSKEVYVEVIWLMTDTYICGELTVFNDKFQDKKSVLIRTPQNKAIKVRLGESIPLLRSVVSLPYEPGFTVKANLHDRDNVPLVMDFVYFPFQPIYGQTKASYSTYGKTRGGEILVKVTVAV